MFIQLPSISNILIFTPIFFAGILALGAFSGWLKLKKRINTGHTRKLFHVGVFTAAAIVGLFFGFKATLIFGGAAGIYTLLAILLGDGNLLYEGIAREKDKPHRTLYIIIPFFATAIGGLASNYFFSAFAVAGYLVAGWGDAAGEIFGTWFGKHKYCVPSILKKVKCQRSIEGSLAVFVMTFLIIAVYIYKIMSIKTYYIFIVALVAAAATAIIEAISPHGVDNFTTQIAATAVCYFMLI